MCVCCVCVSCVCIVCVYECVYECVNEGSNMCISACMCACMSTLGHKDNIHRAPSTSHTWFGIPFTSELA